MAWRDAALRNRCGLTHSYRTKGLKGHIPSSPACLTSRIDTHALADCSSRVRLATDTKPLPSSSQGWVSSSGSSALRAVTLFRKCRMASRVTGPSGPGFSARTLSRRPKKLEALSKDRIPGASDSGLGRSCG